MTHSLPELMRQHAEYMDSVHDFVGSPDAISRALRDGADEIERLQPSSMTQAQALEIVLDLALQNLVDKRDHPKEHSRQVEAIKIISALERRWMELAR